MGALEFKKKLKMHNKVTIRMYLTFYLMVHLSMFYLMVHLGMKMSVQLRVLLMVHQKAQLYLRLVLRVHLRLQLSCT